MNVFSVKNLRVAFPTPRGIIRAVEGIDLSIERGECLALVGESGCGKSVTSLASLKLLDPSVSIVKADEHTILGENMLDKGEREMESIRGKKASMIFQDALSALNPVMSVGKQLDEVFTLHFHLKKREAKARSIEALRSVGIENPEARYRAFPHELSGGMRQRVLIAMAFASNPALIIADEPTTALDVTVQKQILSLLSEMRRKNGTALLLISHDLSVVYSMADRIAVMYSGRIVEEAPAEELIRNPLHPYTKGLMGAVVRIDDKKERFTQIPGGLPDPANKPEGCYFAPRCAEAAEKCGKCRPKLAYTGGSHYVRCFMHGGERDVRNEQ